MNVTEETKSVLRVAMRYDNYYKADVEIDCFGFIPSLDNKRYTVLPFEEIQLNSMVFPKTFVSPYTKEPNCTIKGGFAISLLLEISYVLNLKVELAFDLGSHEFANATNRSVDLFVGQYYLKEERAVHADPSYITGITKESAFINHEFESNQLDILVEVFNLQTKLILLATVLIALISIGCVSYYHSNILNTDSSKVSDILFEGLSVVLLKGGLALQGCSLSLHLAFLVTSLCSFCLLVAYSGAIVAMLTVPTFSIDSIANIVKSHYLVMLDQGYNNGSSLQSILESLRHQATVNSLLQKISSSDFRFESFDKSMELVRDTASVYITDEQTGIATIQKILRLDIPCTWSIISVEDISNYLSFYLGKQSPYKKKINACLLKLDEKGIMKHYHKKWAPSSESCSGSTRIIEPVKMYEVRSAYWIFLFGLNLSLVAYLFEKMIYSHSFSTHSKKTWHEA